MVVRVPKLAALASEKRARLLTIKQDLHYMKWTQIPKHIPGFVTWYSAHFRPSGTSHKEPLFFGVAYTTNRRHDELVKVVTLSQDGTLKIRPIRENEMGKDIGYKTGAEE